MLNTAKQTSQHLNKLKEFTDIGLKKAIRKVLNNANGYTPSKDVCGNTRPTTGRERNPGHSK
jgi:hypothetical protein